MSFFHEYHKEPLVIHNQKIYFEPHLHDEVEIIALFEGSTALVLDGKDYRMDAGDFLIVFPNTIHSYKAETKVDVGKFIFNFEGIPEFKEIFRNKFPRNPVIKREKADTTDLLYLAKEILLSYQSSSDLVKKAYLLLFTGKLLELCELEEKRKSDNDTINSVLEYCKNNYHFKITQQSVADALFISRSYLSHIFCCKMKINFCEYINILRTNEARNLLCHTNKSIIEISEECGFSSLRTFNRAFVKLQGMTPKEYRGKSAAKKGLKKTACGS